MFVAVSFYLKMMKNFILILFSWSPSLYVYISLSLLFLIFSVPSFIALLSFYTYFLSFCLFSYCWSPLFSLSLFLLKHSLSVSSLHSLSHSFTFSFSFFSHFHSPCFTLSPPLTISLSLSLCRMISKDQFERKKNDTLDPEP